MNILFFLTPKSDVAFVLDTCSIRQVLEKMEQYRYTALPILDNKGQYVGVLTEGDLLRYLKDKHNLNLRNAEVIEIASLPRRWDYHPVNVDCSMEELVETSMQQNFVPVVDDSNVFIGIIRRKHIIEHFYKKVKAISN